ncbi:MAG TPA: WYL domain-containing protein [Prolixibacteraceae bacterium]|nr:WYL domain-containing protein [Prolixibacteraceae bacterium]
MDQPKLDRLLRLMKMLTGNTTYSISELAERLSMTERTIYRYIDTFREAGFVIKKNGAVYRIDKSSPYFKDISQLIHFTEEEAYILKSAIESIDENNLIKQNLKRKLYTIYNYKILAETVVKGKNALNVNRLVEAIENKKQVVLREYGSAHTHSINDRLVEPFAFTTNYIQIWAYEPSSKQNKLFKLSRMGEVVVLDAPWSDEERHCAGSIDCFRISSHVLLPVKLRLGMRAAQLLIEEYPLAEKELTKVSDNEWIFETNVCSYDGVGRFVEGLLHEVEIMGPPEFKCFIMRNMEEELERMKR